ncbi:MAG: F0F1 ATP synthase subunit B [Pseudomonadota bacterium]
MANLLLLQATVEQPGPEAKEPTAFGINASGWIALAMLVVIGILLWGKAHRKLASALDEKIATIRNQLAEAEGLRKDAEALRSEYEAKAKSVDKERKAMLERARKEAAEIVAKAQVDAEALIERRGRMAEDKIAAEERSAINLLRNAAATAATNAAARLIAERNDPATDARLIDQAIGDIGR